jgi:hypothetical protein
MIPPKLSTGKKPPIFEQSALRCIWIMFLIAYTTAQRCIRLRNSCQAFIAGRQDLRQETMNLFGICGYNFFPAAGGVHG